jgi:putative transposase
MCQVLEIGLRGYYTWKVRLLSKNKKKSIEIKKQIDFVYFSSKQRYGSPRIAAELTSSGCKVCRITVAKYMREMGLSSKLSRKFKITTDSKHKYSTMPNILNREFTVTGPSKVWVSDITYISTKEGFLYLTTIIDLYDRKVIGWSLSNGMSTDETVLVAWKMAVKTRSIEKGLIFHSDRGIQYANKKISNVIDSYKTVRRSMSRKGNCWDNAVAESFFKTLKTEQVYRNKLISKEQMRLDLFEYIEIWYNRKRRHSALQYKTIEEFWKQKNDLKNVA